MRPIVLPLTAVCALLLAACQPDAPPARDANAPAETVAAPPGNIADTAPYAGIAEDEVLHALGTEPFWGVDVDGKTLNYSHPENADGTTIMVERFAGRGGISYSGLLDGAEFEMAVTAEECGDGMSERIYPFTVTLAIGEDRRDGCAWSEQHPFKGDENP